jgi:hypothetical protein
VCNTNNNTCVECNRTSDCGDGGTCNNHRCG